MNISVDKLVLFIVVKPIITVKEKMCPSNVAFALKCEPNCNNFQNTYHLHFLSSWCQQHKQVSETYTSFVRIYSYLHLFLQTLFRLKRNPGKSLDNGELWRDTPTRQLLNCSLFALIFIYHTSQKTLSLLFLIKLYEAHIREIPWHSIFIYI